MSTELSIEQQGEVAVLKLGKGNSFPLLSLAMLYEIGRGLIEAGRSRNLRGIVITGSDSAFATGANLAEVSGLTAASAVVFSRVGQGLFLAIERFPKPVVAAIRGYCLGGGLDLALACHFRIASTDAVFGHPGGSLGIMTGFGGTQRLPRLIGRARAMEMLATGRIIPAEEACSWRLVTRVVRPEDLLTTSLEAAKNAARFRAQSHSSAEGIDR